MAESRILKESLVGVSALPLTLCWRNNTGMAWQSNEQVKAPIGGMVRVEPGMVILRNARPVRFGLPGSGDAVGVTNGEAWVVETKTPTGPQAELQRKFGAAWSRCGGHYQLARSPEQAVDFVKRFLP